MNGGKIEFFCIFMIFFQQNSNIANRNLLGRISNYNLIEDFDSVL